MFILPAQVLRPHTIPQEAAIPQPESYPARCASTLERALNRVPFYRDWKSVDPGPSLPVFKRLAVLPVLTKRNLRANVPRGFMDDTRACAGGFASGDVEIVTTSGTAEDRASVVWHQPWWDRSEREAARLHPVLDRAFSAPHREAVLTSPVCAGNLCHVGDATMEERTLGSLLFLNQALDPAAWNEGTIRRMAREMELFRAEVLEADPAYLALFSRAATRAGFALHQPSCIVLTYEFPSRIHYRAIARAFPGVPVVSSYGSTETGHVFTQCDRGAFHQNTATCHVDIQPIRPDRGDSRVGRILVSTLDNHWFTLLRFDIGDLARVQSAPCTCGRTDGLVLESIEGRLRDITFDCTGRVVTVKQVDDALGVVECIAGYQVEQDAHGSCILRYVVEPGGDAEHSPDVGSRLLKVLRDVYGPGASIELRRESSLSPEQSGKFRLARTALPVRAQELF
jgi:phenylacetate-coenzyme A ligase PaaK-like adenylate-forming protein